MADDHESQDPPERLYKYRSASTYSQVKKIEQTLLFDQIFFASAISFNDPFELSPCYEFEADREAKIKHLCRVGRRLYRDLAEVTIRDRVVEMVDGLEVHPGSEAEVGRKMAEETRHHSMGLGIYCLATSPDDLLMWAHYADSHCGICLEFDSTGGLFPYLREVKYQDDRPMINVYVDSQWTKTEKGLLTKSSHWRYEGEWRALDPAIPANKVVEIRPSDIVGVIIGAMASDETVYRVRQWARRRKHPLALRRARLSSDRYALELVPLEPDIAA